jgi:dihydroorotase
MSSAPRLQADSTDRGSPQRYDLVIAGGIVIDPAQRIHARKDVAIRDGKIAALQDRIDPSMALRVIDVDGGLCAPA